MNIFGLFGRFMGAGGHAFAETLDSSIDRQNVRFLLPADSALYLNWRSRRSINEKVEWIWQHFGFAKELGAGIARHTVADGMTLELNSTDEEWNQLAEDDFAAYAETPDRCDLSGRRTFAEATTTAVEQRVFRGEFFAAKTENPEWDNEPCFQMYDTEEICTPPDAICKFADGKVVLDGCELNAASKTIAYHIRGLDGLTWSEVERSRMMHWYKPHAINQVRGVSDLAQAVNPLVDFHELQRLATRSAKAQHLVALVLKGVEKSKAKGAFGALTPAKNVGSNSADNAQLEAITSAAGAGIAYVGENGDAKLITPTTPAPNVEAWCSSIFLPNAAAAAGIPLEFFWPNATAKVGGAPMRFILSRASLYFMILGKGVKIRFCTPVAYRYLKVRMDSGKLRPCKDPDWDKKIDWQGPPLVTVDNGNDGNLQIELLANGLITLRQYCAARGLNYRHVMRQWIREPIEFLKMAKAEGAPPEMIERWQANMPIWRAAKPGAATTLPEPSPKKDPEESENPPEE